MPLDMIMKPHQPSAVPYGANRAADVRLDSGSHAIAAGRYYPCGSFFCCCLRSRGPGLHSGGGISTLGMGAPTRVPCRSRSYHCDHSSASMGGRGMSPHGLGKRFAQGRGRTRVHRHVYRILGEQAGFLRRPAVGVYNDVYTVRVDRVRELVHRETSEETVESRRAWQSRPEAGFDAMTPDVERGGYQSI